MANAIKPTAEREAEYREVMDRVMTDHAPPIATWRDRIRIAVMETDRDAKPYKPLMFRGRPRAATASLVPSKWRRLYGDDGLVTFDAMVWDSLSDPQRVALVHHELLHFDAIEDDDATGRPKVKLRPHDFEVGGFHDVIADHGPHAMEFRLIATEIAMRPKHFMPLFDAAERLMDGKPIAASPRLVSVPTGGTAGVEVYDDESVD